MVDLLHLLYLFRSLRRTLILVRASLVPFLSTKRVFRPFLHTATGPGMDNHGFLHDESVLDQLAAVLPGVGVDDLVGVEPDPVLAALIALKNV